MTEPTDNLETRLSSLRPRPITGSLENQIARAIAPPAPTRAAIGLFWTTVAGGAIAASTILLLLTAHSPNPPRLGESVIVIDNQKPPANFTALASADWRWGDELNFNESRRLP